MDAARHGTGRSREARGRAASESTAGAGLEVPASAHGFSRENGARMLLSRWGREGSRARQRRGQRGDGC